MKIAVEGCAHGELETIYAALEDIQRTDNIKIDLLLCCGDFQAVRNEMDLHCMAVPHKYRQMCSFYKYYSGEKKAPILTIFIGGNHEASNHLWELPFGGWVAPNIYYLGYSGVVNFGGFRIAGLSGIYKHHDYHKGHFESPPFNQNTMRSIYHVRSLDTFKLKLLSNPVNMVMSHDWPRGVYHYGDIDKLLRWKKFLRQEVESNTLGSRAGEDVLRTLQPDYWFSAHLHVRFPATVKHSDTLKMTNFLALDKCLPKRKYLEVIDVGPATGPLELTYDPEWLAITKITMHLVNTEETPTQLPSSDEEISQLKPTEDIVKEVSDLFDNDLKIPENFSQSVTLYNPSAHKKFVKVVPNKNVQTDTFCRKLKITNPFWVTDLPEDVSTDNPDEISLSDEEGEDDLKTGSQEFSKVDGDASQDQITLSDSENKKEHESSPKVNMVESDFRFPEFKTSTETCDSSASNNDTSSMSDLEPPTKKTFKFVRRNQALYTSADDSDS